MMKLFIDASSTLIDSQGAIEKGAINHIPCKDWSHGRWLNWSWPALVILLFSVILQLHNALLFLFLNLNHWAAELHIDPFWSCLTMLGDTNVILLIMTPLVLWRPSCFAAVLASAPSAGIIGSALLKKLFHSPRPGSLLDSNQFHIIGRLLSEQSFPSGHSITVFAIIAAILASSVPQRNTLGYRSLAILLLCCASLAAFSRIAVGAHWPIDTIAGASIGWLAGLNGAWLSSRYNLTHYITRYQLPLLIGLALLGIWLVLRLPDDPNSMFTSWFAAISAWLVLIMTRINYYRKLN